MGTLSTPVKLAELGREIAGHSRHDEDGTGLEVAMDDYASWLGQQREDAIVPPEADP